jgi:hypothetical protein
MGSPELSQVGYNTSDATIIYVNASSPCALTFINTNQSDINI